MGGRGAGAEARRTNTPGETGGSLNGQEAGDGGNGYVEELSGSRKLGLDYARSHLPKERSDGLSSNQKAPRTEGGRPGVWKRGAEQ